MATAVLATLVAFAPAADSKPHIQMEHNAFLRKPALSSGQLVNQLDTDPLVAHRYEKHFMMGEKDLARYMAGLHLRPLTETKRYLVYNIDGNMVIQKRLLTLRRGTLVFVDAKGTPILKRSCGNPMVSYIPPKGKAMTAYAPVKPIGTDLEPEPETLSQTVIPPSIDFSSLEPSDTIAETSAPTIDPEPEAVPGPKPIVPVAAGGFVPLWPLLGLPLIPALFPGGGGGTGGVPVIPPVPEPISLLVLAGGAGLLVRRKSRNK